MKLFDPQTTERIRKAAGDFRMTYGAMDEALKDIQRALEKSEIGINPQSDGKMIRLPVPPLSTERRNQLVGRIRQLAEQQKVAIRNTRRDANKALEAAKKAKTLTEDEVESGQEQIQKTTDDYCKQIDNLLAEKSKEIMEV